MLLIWAESRIMTGSMEITLACQYSTLIMFPEWFWFSIKQLAVEQLSLIFVCAV